MIGVFDSGIGGLTVLEEMKKVLPNEDFLFYADSLNNPYGEKDDLTLYEITSNIVDYLISRDCKIIVIACNTATTRCIKYLRGKYPDIVFVGTEPAIKVACDRGFNNILVMATPATINSERTNILVNANKRDYENVFLVPCEGLANAIELNDSVRQESIISNIYEEYKDKCNIYLKLPRVLLKHPNYKDERLLITEIGSLNAFKENNNLIADYTLNITNKESIKLLEKNNVNLVTISPEITMERLKNIDKFDSDIQYIIYGTIELMIMKYCPLKMLENNDNNNCNLCSRNNKYYLKDQNNFKYPVLNTKHYTHIMHKEPINNIKDIKLCLEKGINNFRIDLLYETKQEIENIIKEIKKELGD